MEYPNLQNEPIYELMSDQSLRDHGMFRCYKCGEVFNMADKKQDEFGDLMCPDCYHDQFEIFIGQQII